MENLPFLFLRKLFKMMPSLNEAIKCSLVCRNWRAAYEAAIKPEMLCLYHQNYLPLNHRLFYSNDRVSKFSFLRLYPHDSIHFRFFDSGAAAIHFASIKKLVIFSPFEYTNLSLDSLCKLSFKDQLNPFKSLEYLDIGCDILALEGCEIALPNLKIFSCGCEFKGEKQIILNTPSLEAMRVITGNASPENYIKIVNFKFVCPDRIKHLDLTNYETDFKFDFSSFLHLECLVFSSVSYHIYEKKRYDQDRGIEREIRLFGDDFLGSLPNLKFLFFDNCHSTRFDLPKLVKEKRKFNLNDLKIFNCSGYYQTFDYQNWPRYLKHKEQFKYWPGEFSVIFNKLISFRVPPGLFKENYFKIGELKVRQVNDQALLVEFLKNTEIRYLSLEYDFNLGQSFFDEIVDSVPALYRLCFVAGFWNRFTNLSVLNKLNMLYFEVYYKRFQREAALAVMTNPACFTFDFSFYDRLSEHNFSGELRKEPLYNTRFCHIIRRIKREFFCQPCCWISTNDPKRSLGPLEVTLRHVESERKGTNMTIEEMENPELCLHNNL